MYLGQGLYITAVGMGLVFLALAVLLFAIMALDRVFPARAEAANQALQIPRVPPPAAPNPVAAPALQAVSPPSSLEAAIGGRRFAVVVGESSEGHRQVVVDGASHDVRLDPKSTGSLVIDGLAYRAEVLDVRPGAMTVRVEGTTFEVELPDDQEAPAPAAPSIELAGDEPVLAPLPGKVLRVAVASGARVERGQELCVLEAMKMENSIRSPREGVVREVRTAAGKSVSAGEPLVILGGTP